MVFGFCLGFAFIFFVLVTLIAKALVDNENNNSSHDENN